MNSLWQIFLASAAGTAFIQFLYQIVGKLFDEWRLETQRKRSEKRVLADEAIKICTEASSKAYSVPARDSERVIYVITQLESIDQNLSTNLELFYSTWQIYASENRRIGQRVATTEEIQFGLELQKRAEDFRKKIIKSANKLKNS